jgi:SAM-dependent methyltransferase
MSFKDPSAPDFGSVAYWEQRYEEQRHASGKNFTFDWYVPYANIQEVTENFATEDKSDKVLVVGCGNSMLIEDMYETGFHDITGIDFSKTAIEMNIAKYREKEGMDFLQGHVQRMDEFEDDRFGLIIDKACMDSCFCGLQGVENVEKMIEEIYRVLQPGGTFLCITYGEKEMRKMHLNPEQGPNKGKYDWGCEHTFVRDHASYHIYICTRVDPDKEDIPLWQRQLEEAKAGGKKKKGKRKKKKA